MSASVEQLRNQLIQRKKELNEQIEAIKADFKRGLPADSEERAQALENSEVLNALMERAIKELEQVNDALSKLR